METFYRDLAEYWPLMSPLEDYAEESTWILQVLKNHAPNAKRLLELGSGGGHVSYHLKNDFSCCLSDVSEAMLNLSRRLNPECAHLVGDMRTIDAGQLFDIVFAHDSIGYMVSEEELRAVFRTAWRHLEPGGVACFVPDEVLETFEPGENTFGSDASDGRAVRILEWTEPMSPGEHTATVHYSFLVRGEDGRVDTFYDRHRVGVFPRAVWEQLLVEQGFEVEVEVEVEQTTEQRSPRFIFLGRKPHRSSSVREPTPHEVIPIGYVRGGRTTLEDDDWGAETAVIELDARFDSDSMIGVGDFSHIEVVFVFDRISDSRVETGSRHPRGRTDFPRVGVFAQRGKSRPNRIGVSRCRLLDVDGTRLHVQGLDAIDGTPVLDIKPYMREFGPRGETRQPEWSVELMRHYY